MHETGVPKHDFPKAEFTSPPLPVEAPSAGSETQVTPEMVAVFRERVGEARKQVLDKLQAAPTLAEYLRFSNAYRYLVNTGSGWMVSAGAEYAVFFQASVEEWVDWAVSSTSEGSLQTEVQRIEKLQAAHGEVVDPLKAHITLGRFRQKYSEEEYGYEYRVLATLPPDADVRLNVPFNPVSQDRSKQVYLQPTTGCTYSAIHSLFAGLPESTESLTLELEDLSLDVLLDEDHFNHKGGMLHYWNKDKTPEYDWNYVLFGTKGGFSNETNVAVPKL